MNDKSVALTSDIQDNLDGKKLKEAIRALEAIRILGDKDWKSERARQAIVDIERIRK